MTAPGRNLAIAAWLGFALAALFFYPLAAAIDADVYYMQWQPAHSIETLVALGLLAAVVGPLVFLAWPRSSRLGTLALAAIALVPLLSLGAGVSRQLPIDDALRIGWESSAVRYGASGLVAAAMLAMFAFAPTLLGRLLRSVLVIVSPISVVVVETLVLSAVHSAPSQVTIPLLMTRTEADTTCPSVLALLFDEMSFSYLYDGDQIRPEYPALREFSAGATNYLAVRSPGDETLVSVPGYLAGHAFDHIRVEGDHLDYDLGPTRAVFSAQRPDGLFATARAWGLVTEAAGYYFPYCSMLGSVVDVCRSLSFYNAATVDAGFSLTHPFVTTFILWPRQFPLGLFKNPAFARLQRRLVEETHAFARRPFGTDRTFRFVHYSIPHLPFVYDANGYNPPFDPLRQRPDTGYANQLLYADRLLGEVMAGLRQSQSLDRTSVIVFSDHGFRSGGREQNTRHVPFLLKRASQTRRYDVSTALDGAELLRQQTDTGCRFQ